MKLDSRFVALSTLLFLSLFSQDSADLNADRQAILDFISQVPHARKLHWNLSTSVCTAWVGVGCSQDGTRINSLRLPGIGLYGKIPANTLGRMDALAILSLRSNMLHGDLPSDLLSAPSLRYVNLEHNDLSGHIPSLLSPKLSLLDLAFNSFTSSIPSSISNLTKLTRLKLENNFLTGNIPQINIPSLKLLNVSNNHLSGSVPSSLQHFPASSFEGNSLLCGSPVNVCSFDAPAPSPSIANLPPYIANLPPYKKEPRLSTGIIVGIAVGGSLVIFLLILLLGLCSLKNKEAQGASTTKGDKSTDATTGKPQEDFGSGVQDAEKNKLVFFESCSYNFDLEDLLRASAEVLGKGTYGTAYKAILEEGVTVVVKRLKDVVVGKKEFEQQMELVGRIGQHPNVVPLRAYYYSKDEKLLVYDYISAGSFSAMLHGSQDIGRSPLDWDSRVKVALGAAKGISYIHSAAGGKFIHGNIRASNVLLNEHLQGSISDFGLTSLTNFPMHSSRSAGYRAPEVIETRKFSQKSDVYSFGVLLLEMLTGKAPTQSSGHEDVIDLPRWVQSVVREEWTAEVFDVELLKFPNVEEELVQMLQIAMACVEKNADMRPNMEQVIRMIEELRNSGSDINPSPEDRTKISPALTP
ncbi:unnamed protein product [Rhodiola kirilowii]